MSSRHPPRADASALTQLTSIMNKSYIKSDINPIDAENKIMNKPSAQKDKKVTDISKVYEDELNSLAAQLGVDILIPSTPSVQPRSPVQTRAPASSPAQSEASDCSCDSSCSDGCDCDCHECDCDSECSDGCDCECHSDVESIASMRLSKVHADIEKKLGIKFDSGDSRFKVGRSRSSSPARRSHSRDYDSVVANITKESHSAHGAEREKYQELKAAKLQKIAQLKVSLSEEGIDCGGITMPTMHSNIEEIDSTLNILVLKNDCNRYSSIADEVLIACAHGLETVFDGTKEYPVFGRLDYTNYHNTVAVKLHRMRYETSQLVGSIIEQHKIGPLTRVLIELVPSLFLYPRQQRSQRGMPGLSSEPRVADAKHAMNTIRRSDASINDLRNL